MSITCSHNLAHNRSQSLENSIENHKATNKNQVPWYKSATVVKSYLLYTSKRRHKSGGTSIVGVG